MRRVVSAIVALAAAVSSLATAASCTTVPDTPWPTVRNVVFVTIDTLRADHTSVHDYPVDTTPFLTELAQRGITFDRAYAHSATTAPSHASMFTGLYPLQHRVQTNGQKLDARFTTVAGQLRDAGWRTGAYVSAPAAVFGGSDIRRGFTDYDDPQTSATGLGEAEYRPAAATVDGAIDWLQSSDDTPFFLWVHLYDPHKPLQPQDQHLSAVQPRTQRDAQVRDRELRRQRIRRRPSTRRQVLEYDAEIRYADAELRRLYAAAGLYGAAETLWVVTSDHGQGLTTHKWFGHHVQIYNTQLHVPLIFAFPGGWNGGRRVADRLVGHVDLAPTLLALLGQPDLAQAAPLQGLALSGLLETDRPWDREAVFAERRVPLSPSSRARANEPGTRHALQTLTRKYQLFSDGPDEYYHLDVDPYEQTNRIDEADAEAFRLRAILQTIAEQLAGDFEAETLTDAELGHLRALGYIQ